MYEVTRVFEEMSPQSYLSLVVGSILISLGLRVAGKKEGANFVGLWAPTILNVALYMKLVRPSQKKSLFR